MIILVVKIFFVQSFCVFLPFVLPVPGFVVGLPETGRLQLELNSDAADFGGHGAAFTAEPAVVEEPFLNLPFSAALDLPPMSAVYYRFQPERRRPGQNAAQGKNNRS